MPRGTWQGSGTWQASGGGGRLLLLVVVLAVFGSGAVAAVATVVVVALIAAVAVIVLSAAGLGAYLACRGRRGNTAPRRSLVQPYAVHQLGTPERPALGQPRELHLHFHGADPEEAAAILRQAAGLRPDVRGYPPADP